MTQPRRPVSHRIGTFLLVVCFAGNFIPLIGSSNLKANEKQIYQKLLQQGKKKRLRYPLIARIRVGDRGVTAAVFSAHSRYLLTGGQDVKDIQVWDLEKGGELEKELKGHNATLWRLTISPDGKWLASASKDMDLNLWDLQTWKLKHSMKLPGDYVNALAFSADNKSLVTGVSHDLFKKLPNLHLWDVQTGKLKKALHRATKLSYSSRISISRFIPGGSVGEG